MYEGSRGLPLRCVQLNKASFDPHSIAYKKQLFIMASNVNISADIFVVVDLEGCCAQSKL